MNSHALNRPSALSRRTLLGQTALGMAAMAGLGPHLVEAALTTLTAGTTDLIAGNTVFALNLYAALRQDADIISPDGNLLFSPYSVSLALAMTYAGARGQTATQMAQTLAFSLDQPALHEAFSVLNDDLVARGNAEDDPANYVTGRGLRIANGLWGERTFPFSDAYTSLLARYYGAGFQQTDFAGAPEEGRLEINAWVAEQTEYRIREIVPEGAITPTTRLVLANAIHFHSAWMTKFDPEATRDSDFHLHDGTTVTVPFMFQHTHLSYSRGDGFQMIEFPYAGDVASPSGFAFTIILPDEGLYEAFEARLTPETLDAAMRQPDYTEVLVYLPKFGFDFGTDLTAVLQAMGMTDAYDLALADFSGMQEEGIAPQPLWIGPVLHKAFIAVDEDGTEAGAATVVVGVGAGPPAEDPPEVRIDRPFLFAVRDTETGTLLFLGRVMDPSA